MAFDRQAALAAGYTEQEIDEFLRKQQQTQAPGAAPGAEPPPPSTVIQPVESGITSPAGLATTGLGIAEVAVPAAVGVATYKAGEYGLKKLGEAFRGAPTAPTPTGPVAPVAPPSAPATSPILGANGQPIVRTPPPAAPAPSAPAQSSVLDKATQMVRQLAANRVVQGAARIGGTAAAALTPGNVGQNYPFPQTGPLAGSEINPGTGRPWTKQELDAYRARYGG
jgi:hypothetical protein